MPAGVVISTMLLSASLPGVRSTCSKLSSTAAAGVLKSCRRAVEARDVVLMGVLPRITVRMLYIVDENNLLKSMHIMGMNFAEVYCVPEFYGAHHNFKNVGLKRKYKFGRASRDLHKEKEFEQQVMLVSYASDILKRIAPYF